MPGRRDFNDPDYVDVAARIKLFKTKHPEGSLQAEVIGGPQGFVSVKAYAYRTPDDPRPGTGLAWEPFPGLTPFTKNSELQNAETSAWGRAIVAALAADTKKIASAEEVRNRQNDWPEAVDPAAPTVAAVTAGSASSEGSGSGVASARAYGEGAQPDLSDSSPRRGDPDVKVATGATEMDILEDTTLEKIVEKYGVNKGLAAARRMGFKVTSLGQLTEAEAQKMLDGEVA